MSKNSYSKKGIFLLILSAFFYSLMPLLARMLNSHGIPIISQVSIRYVVAFIVALVYFSVIKKTKFTWPHKNIPLLLLATFFGYGLTNLFFTVAVIYTQVSTTLFLFYTYAILAPILGFLLLKDNINKFNVISLALSFVALVLLFQPTAVSSWKIGAIFAILSALGQTAYLISRKKLGMYSSSYMMLANTFVGMITVGLLGLIFESQFYQPSVISHISLNTWIVDILFGFNNFLAWFAMTKGFEYFHATSASVILLSELVFGLFFAFLFFQEIPTIATFFGGVLIIFATVIVIYKGKS